MLVAGALLAEPLLADPEDAGKAGPLGLLAVIVLGVAAYFLFKSMSRHLRKVRDSYPDPNVDMRTTAPIPPRPVDPAPPVPPRAEPPRSEGG